MTACVLSDNIIYNMVKFIPKTIQKLFSAELDFRVRLFNILAAAGVIICMITGVCGIFNGAGPANLIINMLIMALSAALLWYSFSSGRYQLCYTITVILIFLGLFPALFISTGGYHSGMPSFFIFAVLFTVFMLEGKKMVIMSALELAVYTSICIFAYFNPEKTGSLGSETAVLVDIIAGFTVASAALGVTMALHLSLYNRRQRELEAARKQVEEYAKMKSELFAGMSHEMRAPLTVMSAYAQYAVEQIRELNADEQTLADLATISEEAKRLAEMAEGTLKILTATSEINDPGTRGKLPVDMGTLSSRIVRLLEHVASRKGIKISAAVKDNVPQISGDADALTQLLWNILQNGIIHSDGKNINLNVEACSLGEPEENSGVKITICDDGSGIEPDLLPDIFERGVSGKEGGSGIGLSICRDIARRHCGDITITSRPGNTRVTILLRSLP